MKVRGGRELAGCVLVLAVGLTTGLPGCGGGASPTDAAQAGDLAGAPPADAASSVDATPPDLAGGSCASRPQGPYFYLLSSSLASGTHLYKIYPDSDSDEEIGEVVIGTLPDTPIGVEDFTIVNHQQILVAPSYRLASLTATPGKTGPKLLLGDYPKWPNQNDPPETSWISQENPFTGVSGGNVLRFAINGLQSHWSPAGTMGTTFGMCRQLRDFVMNPGSGNVARFLAWCGADRNAIVEVAFSLDNKGNPVGQAMLHQGLTAPDAILGIVGNYWVSAQWLYKDGQRARRLGVCVNGLGNAPIPDVVSVFPGPG